MALREVTWSDRDGRRFVVMLPDLVPDSEARRGVPIGPPDLSGLGLPHSVEVRLNNELVARRLLRREDLRGRIAELTSAVMAACRLDAQAVEALYEGVVPQD